MFFRILRKSLVRRKGRIAIAVIAVMMGAAIATALINVSLDITDKVGYEFRAYGANILLVPKSDTVPITIGDIDYGTVAEQRYIDEKDLDKIMMIHNNDLIVGYAPYLYQVVTVENQSVVLTGTWFDQVKKVSPWWDIKGSWIDDRNDTTKSIIGVSVAEKLDLEIGDLYTVIYNDTKNETAYDLLVAGIVTTGSSEDNQIFVNLDVAQDITQRPDKVNVVQVSAHCFRCPVDDIAEQIMMKIPYLEAKSVKRVAEAEMDVLGKLEQMMMLLTIVMLAASALGVMATMTTSVVERKKEIGMMKAIGAENKKIASLFLCEALIIGVLGGILGYIVGIIFAQFIGMSVFNSAITPRISVFPIALGISVGVSSLASILPVRKAVKIEPARVLRGE